MMLLEENYNMILEVEPYNFLRYKKKVVATARRHFRRLYGQPGVTRSTPM